MEEPILPVAWNDLRRTFVGFIYIIHVAELVWDKSIKIKCKKVNQLALKILNSNKKNRHQVNITPSIFERKIAFALSFI